MSADLQPIPAAPTRPSRDRYDVVVVGARAAGAATAHLLARLGLDVLLVDRSRYGADTLSTHALMRGGVMQLSRWGLLDAVIAAGTPPCAARPSATAATSSRSTSSRLAASTPCTPRGAPSSTRSSWTPPSPPASRCASASRSPTSPAAATTRSSASRLTPAAATRSPCRPGSSSAPTASGRRSPGWPERARSAPAPAPSATTYGYWRGLELDGYEWNFRSGANSGVIPTNDGAANVFVLAPPARVGRGGEETFLELLADSSPELAERVAAAEAVSPLRTFMGRPGHVRRSWGPGWALVGDAGYYKDPISAHGITDALRDAELVARATVEVVAGGVPEREALAGYQARRDQLSGDLFDVVDAIAGHQWTDGEIGGLLMRLNVAMAAELEAIAALPDLPAPAQVAA